MNCHADFLRYFTESSLSSCLSVRWWYDHFWLCSHARMLTCARLPDNWWLDPAKLCWAAGAGAGRATPGTPGQSPAHGAICHTHWGWHMMGTQSAQSRSCFTPILIKRLGLTFCCGLEVTGWRAQLTQPLPSHTFCKVILFTSQISKLLLSPFKYRAVRGKIFSRKWKVLTDERRATYLVITRYIRVMVMRLTSS